MSKLVNFIELRKPRLDFAQDIRDRCIEWPEIIPNIVSFLTKQREAAALMAKMELGDRLDREVLDRIIELLELDDDSYRGMVAEVKAYEKQRVWNFHNCLKRVSQ